MAFCRRGFFGRALAAVGAAWLLKSEPTVEDDIATIRNAPDHGTIFCGHKGICLDGQKISELCQTDNITWNYEIASTNNVENEDTMFVHACRPRLAKTLRDS